MCRSFENESGVTLPFKFFDPLGMSKVCLAVWQLWQLWVKIVVNFKMGWLDEKYENTKPQKLTKMLRSKWFATCLDFDMFDPVLTLCISDEATGW